MVKISKLPSDFTVPRIRYCAAALLGCFCATLSNRFLTDAEISDE